MTYFERLGLPVRFTLDPDDLERAFLAASRTVHPDHHAGGQDDAAEVNAAYHALRDPIRRAEAILGPGAVPTADSVFLMEMMDLRGRAEAGDSTVTAELKTRFGELLNELGLQIESKNDSAARRALAAAKTVRSLQRQLADD